MKAAMSNAITVNYQTFSDPASGTTLIQGIRGVDGSPDVYIAGSLSNAGLVQGLLYRGPLQGNGASGSWNALTYTAPGVTDVVNTSCYGPNNGADGQVQLVGSYKRTSTGQSALGFYYQGPPDGSGSWQTVSPNGGNTTNVYVHSVMGNLAVGNYDVDGLDNGYAFIWDVAKNVYHDLVAPNAKTTTLYGIWHNGGDSYTLAGGYSEISPGDLSQGFLVDWNASTSTAGNWKTYQYASQKFASIVTHFEGITTDGAGGYHLASDWLNGKSGAGAALARVRRNADGSFGDAQWIDIAYPDAVLATSANTVYQNNILGIFLTENGSGAPTTQAYVAQVALG